LPEEADLPSTKSWGFGEDSWEAGAEAEFCEAVLPIFWDGNMASLATKPRAHPRTTPETRRIEGFIKTEINA
jgi:hypothetical protein